MSELFTYKNVHISVLDDLVRDNIVELGRGDVISKIDIRETPGPYPIYSSSAQNNGKMGEYGKFMFDEEMITWSVDGGGKFFYRPEHKFSVTNVCGYLRLKSNLLDYKYLYSILEFQHDRLSFDYQTKAHPSVIRELYQVPLLDIGEQKKIAEILTSVDELIENTQSQINKLENLKKATLNELTGDCLVNCRTHLNTSKRHSRYKSTRTLSEVTNKIGDGIHATPKYCENGEVFFINGNNLKDGAIQIDKATKRVSTQEHEKYKLDLPASTVLMSINGTIGNLAFYNNERVVLGKSACYLIPNAEIMPEYLFYTLQSDRITKHFKQETTGTTIGNLSIRAIRETRIKLPSIGEQQRIVKILSAIESDKNNRLKKLSKYVSFKKSLLSDLLTGKVRVTVN
jgi:type I restriction enzyme S subunit